MLPRGESPFITLWLISRLICSRGSTSVLHLLSLLFGATWPTTSTFHPADKWRQMQTHSCTHPWVSPHFHWPFQTFFLPKLSLSTSWGCPWNSNCIHYFTPKCHKILQDQRNIMLPLGMARFFSEAKGGMEGITPTFGSTHFCRIGIKSTLIVQANRTGPVTLSKSANPAAVQRKRKPERQGMTLVKKVSKMRMETEIQIFKILTRVHHY